MENNCTIDCSGTNDALNSAASLSSNVIKLKVFNIGESQQTITDNKKTDYVTNNDDDKDYEKKGMERKQKSGIDSLNTSEQSRNFKKSLLPLFKEEDVEQRSFANENDREQGNIRNFETKTMIDFQESNPEYYSLFDTFPPSSSSSSSSFQYGPLSIAESFVWLSSINHCDLKLSSSSMVKNLDENFRELSETAAIDQSKATTLEAVDSSYDSDQESTNSDLKKFVVDLIDSGSDFTTTPTDNTENFFLTKNSNQNSFLSADANNNRLDESLKRDENSQFDTIDKHQQAKLPSSKRGKPKKKTKKQPVIQTDSITQHHEEIDRTTSETLRQEYSEYVTKAMFTLVKSDSSESHQQQKQPQSTCHINLDFVRKLGYQQDQVEQVLDKFAGRQCDENELLSQLIEMGSKSGVKKSSSSSHLHQTQQQKPSLSMNSSYQNHHHLLHASASSSSVFVSNQMTPMTILSAATNHKIAVGKTHSSPVISGSFSANGMINTLRSMPVELRSIVIDGSNVAMAHGKKECFSCRGIAICVDWFLARGHKLIRIFVPLWRKATNADFDFPVKDREILIKLEREGFLHFTPARNVNGRICASYDDRYVLKWALEHDAIIVSNDMYRDLTAENKDYKRLVDERLLMYVFDDDVFMPPDDPLGKHGPSLSEFLTKPMSSENIRNSIKFNQPCPYEKKCTYGNKCKYFHPERNSITSFNDLSKLNESIMNNDFLNGASRKHSTHFDNNHFSSFETSSMPIVISSTEIEKKSLLKTLKSCPPNSSNFSEANNKNSYLTPNFVHSAGNNKKILSRTKSTIPSAIKTSLDSSISSFDQTSTTLSLSSSPFRARNSESQSYSQPQNSNHRKLERQLTINPNADPRLISWSLSSTKPTLSSSSSFSSQLPYKTKSTAKHNHDSVQFESKTCRNELSNQIVLSNDIDQQDLNRIKLEQTKSWSFDRSSQEIWQNNLSESLASITIPNAYSSKNSLIPENHLNSKFISSVPKVVVSEAKSFTEDFQKKSYDNGDDSAEQFKQKRSKLYYHFSQLFPKEKVARAMSIMPNEIDPAALCTAIISINNSQD